MNIVQTKGWEWVVNGALILMFLLSVWLFLENGEGLMTHHPLLDFLPVILWIVVTSSLTWWYGKRPRKQLQRVASYSLIGTVAFFGALVLAVMSLKQQNFPLLAFTIIFYYCLWYYSISLLQQFAENRGLRFDWSKVWIVAGLLLAVLLVSQLLGNLLGSIVAAVLFAAGLWWLYQKVASALHKELEKTQVGSTILLFLSISFLSFIIWTGVFLFLLLRVIGGLL